MREIIFLCGYFDSVNTPFVEKHAKKSVEYSSNAYQKKLINGLADSGERFGIISAPFIGSYPTHSKVRRFGGFSNNYERITYVSFNNLWGYRNISRARSLKKALSCALKDSNADEILILVYAVHEPFLEAADYAKGRDKRVKICLIAPDLPQYMNLSNDQGFLYHFAKKIDIKRIRRHMRSTDSFVLLTEQMKDALEVGNRPYIVVEGIIDADFNKAKTRVQTRKITYTGKLYEIFGVKTLIDAFKEIPDPDIRLVICGTGDCDKYVEDAAKEDSRIEFLGQLTHSEARRIQSESAVLVNPRYSDDEYTKYSFPSKNLEYLSTGAAVVAYLLPGMPSCYEEFLFCVRWGKYERDALRDTLVAALEAPSAEIEAKHKAFLDHALDSLTPKRIVEKIASLNFNS